MQRSIVRTEKLLKNQDEMLEEKFKGLRLSDRELFNRIQMILPEDKKSEQSYQELDKNKLYISIAFYGLFYALPIVIMPLIMSRMDYLVFTNLHLAPREVVVKEKAVYGDQDSLFYYRE